MRSRTRTWFRIHSFTGVMTGLMLFVVCWSGSFAVMAHELEWLAQPAMRVTPGEHRASWGALAQAALEAEPEATLSYMAAPRVGSPLDRYSAMRVLVDLPRDRATFLLIDPYTAEVQGRFHGFGVHRFFRSFHAYLFFPGDGWVHGTYVVGALAITLLMSLVSAFMFYRGWRRHLFRWPRGRGRALWSELHKLGGLCSAWFILVIGLTGAWYLYEMGYYRIVGGPVNYVGGVVQVPKPNSDASLRPLPMNDLLVQARAHYPELEIRTVARGWYAEADDVLYLEGRSGFPLIRDRANQIHLDSRTGNVLWKNGAEDLPPYWAWSNMADPLHFGDFGGIWSKVVWFGFGLVLSGLILTGTYLHAQRLARSGRGRHVWPGASAAVAATAATIVLAGFCGVQEAKAYAANTIGIVGLPELPVGVAAVILAWVAVTLVMIVGGFLLVVTPGLSRRGKRSNP